MRRKFPDKGKLVIDGLEFRTMANTVHSPHVNTAAL